MEKLVEQLIKKHNLNKSEALDAIKMVTEYLKLQHPTLEKLIAGLTTYNENEGNDHTESN